ncbi:unnamed protein product [Effrenium voratum]|uniref:Uncharacterized protein n=1 Tax=Effrenium voratum TaxID=2562239 RepID=A0AA36IVN8_9DINO|nr:unnamed protein product [Effrenium voratum]CAJ1457720.1 unnamed protein product [Effrenium voratum]
MGVRIVQASGELAFQAPGKVRVLDLYAQVTPGHSSTVPTFLRADGRQLKQDDVVGMDPTDEEEVLTLVWAQWWHSFNIKEIQPGAFQKYCPSNPRSEEDFNAAQLELALLESIDATDFGRALQADAELAVLQVLIHFCPESPILKPVREFVAFSVEYLPHEVASVLSVLLTAAVQDMEIYSAGCDGFSELRRFGFAENFTSALSLVEATVKAQAESSGTWKDQAYVYFRQLRPKLIQFLQVRDNLALEGKAQQIDGWMNLNRPFSHNPRHYDKDPRFSGLWSL